MQPGGRWEIPGKAALPPCPGRHCTQDRQHPQTTLQPLLLPTTQPPLSLGNELPSLSLSPLGPRIPHVQLFSSR